MTVVTLGRRVRIDVVAMTIDAGDRFVPARERKIGLAQVIELRVGPARCPVTACAFLPEAAIVLVVFCVAVMAQRRGFAVGNIGYMAFTTLGLDVGSGQLEISQRMIEGTRVQANDIGAPALMFRMACCAAGIQRRRITAVVALPADDIGSDVIMAVQAQGALLVARERHVTLIAIALEVGVTDDDLARHHEFLQVDGPRRRYTTSDHRATDEHDAGHHNDSFRYRCRCPHGCRQYM